ncbi:MAG: glycosyltransferase [Deltaproteobacteria bacterium]|nr:glycosyltransferase [Deltaproteobacteria bacterium]TLN01066.1 MAG: glycosyltransferase family 4 protein [bacterium]
MRILQVHNFYQQKGGEDAVVAAEQEILRANGHLVRLHGVSNDMVQGMREKVLTAWYTPYASSSRLEIAKVITAFSPDIVHVHNFFPLITPSVYDACSENGVPVVQTLHNFRTICPGALLMRDGKPCEKCLAGNPYISILYSCYRASRLGSLAVARMVQYHRSHGTWHEKVDRFIALTEFAKSKFVQAGFPVQKIIVKPNFPTIGGFGEGSLKRTGALFVGRLSEEKGIVTLLQAWEGLDVHVKIMGDGPFADHVKSSSSPLIDYMGYQDSNSVFEAMRQSAFLILPSLCYEGFPMTIVEAFANGLPVIASRLGSMKEIVQEGVTGLHFEPGDSDDLSEKIRWAAEHPEEMLRMGENARKAYSEKYTPEYNYAMLMQVYQEEIDAKKKNYQH